MANYLEKTRTIDTTYTVDGSIILNNDRVFASISPIKYLTEVIIDEVYVSSEYANYMDTFDLRLSTVSSGYGFGATIMDEERGFLSYTGPTHLENYRAEVFNDTSSIITRPILYFEEENNAYLNLGFIDGYITNPTNTPQTFAVRVTITVRGYDEVPKDITINGHLNDTSNGRVMSNAYLQVWFSDSIADSSVDFCLSDSNGDYQLVIAEGDFAEGDYKDIETRTRNIKILLMNGGKPKEWVGGNSRYPYYTEMTEIVSDYRMDANNIDISLQAVNEKIYTAEDLFNVRYYAGGYYELMNDIDLTDFQIPSYHPAGTEEFDLPAGDFPPIYSFYEDYPLSYVRFEGQGFTISNLRVSDLNFYYAGLFKGQGIPFYYYQDIVLFYARNFTLKDVDLKSTSYTGGVAGWVYGSAVLNTNVSYDYENIQVTGRIEGSSDIGGVLGSCNSSPATAKIRKCSFVGTIVNSGNTGGLVGWGPTEIENSFARGSLEGDNRVAGIIGYFTTSFSDGLGKVENSYFAGDLIGTGTKAPIAAESTASRIINNYYNKDLLSSTDFNTNVEGEIARTTDEMTYPYGNNVYLEWEFSDLPDPADYNYPATVDFQNESIEEISYKINDGYPELGAEAIIWFPPPVWVAEGIGLVKFGETFFWVKKNDTWNSAEGFVKSGGSWHPITLADVKKGGSWD